MILKHGLITKRIEADEQKQLAARKREEEARQWALDNPKQAAIRKSKRLLLSTMTAVTMGSQAYYKDPPLF